MLQHGCQHKRDPASISHLCSEICPGCLWKEIQMPHPSSLDDLNVMRYSIHDNLLSINSATIPAAWVGPVNLAQQQGQAALELHMLIKGIYWVKEQAAHMSRVGRHGGNLLVTGGEQSTWLPGETGGGNELVVSLLPLSTCLHYTIYCSTWCLTLVIAAGGNSVLSGVIRLLKIKTFTALILRVIAKPGIPMHSSHADFAAQ